MRMNLLLLLFITALLSACASFPAPAERRVQADALAASHQWEGVVLKAGVFQLQAYVPPVQTKASLLTVYLEGDGFAWISSTLPSADPTPIDPLALRLALAQPEGNIAYLGRPCQYLGAGQPHCSQRYWTGARFSEEVVASLDKAIDQLKARVGAERLILIGYSGGGALSLLLAARRSDVVGIVTVAGNLDPAAWTAHHGVTPLQGSLNPADFRPALAQLPQLHLVGSADRVVPPSLTEAFVAAYPSGHRATVKVMAGYDHACCWVQHWDRLLGTSGIQ